MIVFACLYAPSAAQEQLLALASSFSPLVEDTARGIAVFSIVGLGRLIGTPQEIAAAIARRGAEAGMQANLAISSDPDTAVLAAQHIRGITLIPPGREADRLGGLPVHVLLADPGLIRLGAEKFGSQCIVVSIDAKKVEEGRWEVFSHGGRRRTGLDAVEWAVKAVSLGAGEIVLNSIDADGTKAGFDLVVTRAVAEAVGVPVVASGGAGSLAHMAEVLLEGKADAVLAASIFHYGQHTVGEVKTYLAARGIAVRL